MGVMRLGHVNISVLDMKAALDHYTNALGLLVQHQEADGTAYLKGWDEWDKYSLILSPSDRAGINHFAFKVESDDDLEHFQKRIEAEGQHVSVVKEGELPFCGRALRFNIPSGHQMYLYAKTEFVGKSTGTENPEPWPDGLKGAAVHWLDHVMLMCEVNPEKEINTVAANVQFFKRALGFYLGEQVVAGQESAQVAAWMFRTSTPHDIAFGAGPRMGLHHLAFYLDEWSDVLKAADVFGKRKVKIDVSPQRHGITRGATTYFFDPSGNRNETFAGLGYLAQPDMPPITWTEENIWRGIFFHTGNVAGDFLGVYT